MDIRIVPLGAGQDVGRSCILVSVGGKNVMFDCGMHMGYNDERRFPDFSYISKSGDFTYVLDAVIVTHFHLDHCGALPYFSEMCGYDGPIYMTHPTKAICPILLEDYRKITVERKGEDKRNFFTSAMIKACMKKVVAVNVHQTVQVDEDLKIKAYYAGHVLGAAMFRISVGDQSVVYTGDYNNTPDRHLGGAWIDKCRPDVLITETTYATTIRDSKRCRERDLVKRIHSCVEAGGKVLIPVFALGRAQELCILVDSYWERMNLTVPVFFSAGLTEKATNYYKLFINWTNEKIKRTFVQRNMFDYKHIKPYERGRCDEPGPMVLFATPGMLHAGTSLEVFKKWAGDDRNMVILPGYCVVGTVGNKLQANKKGPIHVDIDRHTSLEVRCKVKNLSFSAHADAKGIMNLIEQCEPKNVVLVHGEKRKMKSLKHKIRREIGVPCYSPPNGSTVTITSVHPLSVDVSRELLKCSNDTRAESLKRRVCSPRTNSRLDGVLVVEHDKRMRVLAPHEAVEQLGLPPHTLSFTSEIALPPKTDHSMLLNVLYEELATWMPSDSPVINDASAPSEGSEHASSSSASTTGADEVVFSRDARTIRLGQSICISVKDVRTLRISWAYIDETEATHALTIIKRALGSSQPL